MAAVSDRGARAGIAGTTVGRRPKVTACRRGVGALLAFALWSTAPAIATSADAGETAWQRMTREDLAFIRETLAAHHPGPVDEANPGFADWLEAGHATALSRLPEVRGFGAWQHLLRLYVEGFADEHLALEFHVDFRWHAWAGIGLAWNGERFVVRETSDDVAVPRGALLASCDGQSAEALWQSHVAPFYARAERPAMRFRHAHRLLLANGNPLVPRPQRCRFESDGTSMVVELVWRGDPAAALPTGPAATEPRAPGIRRIGERGAWLTLPSFGPRGAAADALAATLAALADHRDADVLVVDVRGNGGGSSHWTEVFGRALYGEAYFEHHRHAFLRRQGPMAIDYRASPANLAHFESLLPTAAQQAGEDSEAWRHFTGVVAGLRDAVAGGEPFHRAEIDVRGSDTTAAVGNPVPLFAGRLVLLTDHHCASACLAFADRVLALPRVVHAGQPTSADTTYMEVRGATLPSHLGALSFATKVYRGQRRPGAGDYRPALAFTGDITDTAAVEAWLAEKLPDIARPATAGP